MHRHFEGQWPKPPKKKGAQRGWLLVNTNDPVTTKQLKEKTAQTKIHFRLYCRCFDRTSQ